MGGGNRPLQKPAAWLRLFSTFLRLHQKNPVDIIHSFWLNDATFFGQQLSRIYGVPQVATAMGLDVLEQNRYLSRIDLQRLKVVTLSQRAANAFSVHTTVIPFGVETPGGQSVRDVDLLWVGSRENVKNPGRFVELVSRLRPQFPGLRAVMVGGGALFAPGIETVGICRREEVLEWMGRSKVMVQTSFFEGQGMVVAEALAQGARVVSRPVGMAEAGPGLWVTEALEEVTAKVLKMEGPTGWKGRGMKETVEEYWSLYRSLLDSPS